MIRSALIVAQNFLECGSTLFYSLEPGHMEILSPTVLANNKVRQLDIYGSSIISGDTTLKEKNNFRVCRFLFDDGKMTENVHISLMELGQHVEPFTQLDIKRYNYLNDTVMVFQSAFEIFDNHHPLPKSDSLMDEYLHDSIKILSYGKSDFYFNKNGSIKKIKTRHPITGESLPDNETATEWYSYDDLGRMIEINYMNNYKHFGQQDTLICGKSKLDYNDKEGIRLYISMDNGKEFIAARTTYDKQGLKERMEVFNKRGEMTEISTIIRNQKGMLSQLERLSTEYEDHGCGSVLSEIWNVSYLSNGLPYFVTYTTDTGACSYFFKYGY